MLVWSGADAYIKTPAYPQYPYVVTVETNPLYTFIQQKVEKSYQVNRLEQGLLDTITTQHFNIIWLVKRYARPTPLLRRAIASAVMLCIYKMFAALRYTYIGWTYNEFTENDYYRLQLIKDCTITYYMTNLLHINRYDTNTVFDAIAPPPLL